MIQMINYSIIQSTFTIIIIHEAAAIAHHRRLDGNSSQMYFYQALYMAMNVSVQRPYLKWPNYYLQVPTVNHYHE